MAALRRSQRQACATYEANGRDYLAWTAGWSREKLDHWLISNTVRPRLLLWYNLCYVGVRRFNDAIEWINTGYFYNSGDLEEDILLMCLGEGNAGDEKDAASGTCYINNNVSTCKWSTQELWARAAWQIVQDNCGKDEAFEHCVMEHPARAYSFVIDILCLAFHSLAYRGSESVWKNIIDGSPLESSTRSSTTRPALDNAIRAAKDQDQDSEADADANANADSHEDLYTELETIDETELSTIRGDDREYEGPKTPKMRSVEPVLPKAPIKKNYKNGVSISQWLQAIPLTPVSADQGAGVDDCNLQLMDEGGVPIAGYRRARAGA